MKERKQDYFLHLSWSWISLAINELIVYLILLSANVLQEKMVVACALVPVMTLLGGFSRVRSAKSSDRLSKKDFPKGDCILQYISIYVLSVLMVLGVYMYTKHTSLDVLIAMAVAIVAECAVSVAIQNRYKLINWFKSGSER